MPKIESLDASRVDIWFPSPKVGKFRILYEILNDAQRHPMLKALFGLCIIIDVEHADETGRGKLYYACSELFQELREGEEIPEYRIEMAHDCVFPNPEDEARRLNAGKFGFVAIRRHVLRVPTATLAHVASMPGPIH